MFRFNFEINDEEIVSKPEISIPNNSQTRSHNLLKEQKIHTFSNSPNNYEAICGEEEIDINETSKMVKLTFSPQLYKANNFELSETAKESDIVINSASEVDLQPGVYEGGFKLWECSVDLLHLLDSLTTQNKGYWKDKRVMEIGCGHALPSIFCFLHSSPFVCFQDYNEEVLTKLTMPNLYRNVESYQPAMLPRLSSQTLFLSGDWSSLCTELKDDDKFDIILSSDTLYNESNQLSLYNLIKRSLKYPTGKAYIAAKVYYFGVGGSLRRFEELVKADQYFQSSKIIQSFDDGKSNLRQILLLEF